jgi:hypothetical protein
VSLSIESCSSQILRACGMQPQHFFALLQHFQGRLPQTDQQFQRCAFNFGDTDIIEGARGNIASALRAPMRHARPGAYLAHFSGPSDRPDPGGSTPAFFGQSQSLDTCRQQQLGPHVVAAF